LLWVPQKIKSTVSNGSQEYFQLVETSFAPTQQGVSAKPVLGVPLPLFREFTKTNPDPCQSTDFPYKDVCWVCRDNDS
jgi:hypothetical protein